MAEFASARLGNGQNHAFPVTCVRGAAGPGH